MKGNEKNILIGILVVRALIILGSYKFLYSPKIEEAETVQNEINTLQARVNELNEKNAKRTLYEEGIRNSSDIIDVILSQYGPGNTPEKTIMLFVDMCNKTGVSVSNITFYEDSLVYTSESVDESGNPEIRIYKNGASINMSSGYTQLKKVMDFVNSYPERMNVENFASSYDQLTGNLNTNLVLNMYSVVDKNHTYEPPVIEGIDLGNDNIFKTFEQPMELVEEGEEGAAGTETGNNGSTTSENTESGESTEE